jgi:acyl-CoA thioesterase FadM
VKCEEVMVFIDSENRRSTPIPADVREKLAMYLKEADETQ